MAERKNIISADRKRIIRIIFNDALHISSFVAAYSHDVNKMKKKYKEKETKNGLCFMNLRHTGDKCL